MLDTPFATVIAPEVRTRLTMEVRHRRIAIGSAPLLLVNTAYYVLLIMEVRILGGALLI